MSLKRTGPALDVAAKTTTRHGQNAENARCNFRSARQYIQLMFSTVYFVFQRHVRCYCFVHYALFIRTQHMLNRLPVCIYLRACIAIEKTKIKKYWKNSISLAYNYMVSFNIYCIIDVRAMRLLFVHKYYLKI